MNKDNRRTVMAVGDNPNTVLSYGILMNYIMRCTSKNNNWNAIVNGYTSGPPEKYPFWVKWASGWNENDRDSIYVPNLIKKIKPEFLFSVGDWTHFGRIRQYIEKAVPWIHYLPIDHYDPHHLSHAFRIITSMDIPVFMSKFALDFVRELGIDAKDYIYPFVQTSKMPKIIDNNFSGYKKIVDEEELKKLENFRKEIGSDKKHLLLWVGRPGWRKNLQMLLGAFKLLSERRNDVILYMHTDPSDPCSTFDIGKEIHSQRIEKNSVIFTKDLQWHIGAPKWFLNGIYNIADVYVSTHGGEGFGIPIAEAMATETPFVCTDCTTTPELGKNEEGHWERGLGARVEENHEDRGVIRPYVDIDDFCDKVEDLLDHPEKREKMGKKGRRWVIKNCSVPVVTQKWNDIFNKTTIKRVIVGGINE